ncbi:MAG: NUDIX domain-containing protein [Flavobacteriaceae bacterium]|nr:NUDIX domain-containing protein [Flavobacteriaceae bacterium]
MKPIRKAVMAVLINNDKILIGSSPRDGGYKFPQGGLNPGEDIITGIKRELNEELGILITDSDIIFIANEKVIYYYPPDDPYYIFKAQELSVVKIQYNTSMQLIPQDDEFNKLYWIFPVDLNKYNTNFRNLAYEKALKICGLL